MIPGAIVVLVFANLGGMALAQEDAAEVLVMFDLGGGAVYWQEVALGPNRTGIKATEDAAAALGLAIEVIWSEFGAFVADIGNRDPVFPEYYHFLVWNATAQHWNLASVGASSLTLEPGEILGWSLSADDPGWDFVSPWPGPAPLATPAHPYPIVAFRGDLANTGRTGSRVPQDPIVRWQFDTGGAEIGASPVGALGTVYQVTLFNGTYAIDLATGERRWRAPGVSGISTPALFRDTGLVGSPDLIVGGRDGVLYRLDGASGAVVWDVTLQPDAVFTGIASSPKVYQRQALVGVFNETGGPGALVAVDVADGSVVWRHETGSVHMSSPAIHEGSVFVGLMGFFNGTTLGWDPPYGLLRVRLEDGVEEWMFPTSGPVASSPAVAKGNVIHFTTRDGYLYAVSAAGAELDRREIGPSTSSPAVDRDTVYAASGVLGTEGRVQAVSSEGSRRWRFTSGGPVQSSLTLASGVLLFATNEENGRVYARNATAVVFGLWTFKPDPPQHILSTPVAIDGLVVVASDNGYVYALGSTTESPSAPSDPGTLATAIVVIAGILVAVAIAFYARNYRSNR